MLSRNELLHRFYQRKYFKVPMTFSQLCVVLLVVLVACVKSEERDAPCVTPNEESAKCTPVDQCDVIKEAITTRNVSAIEFAKKSQCGYDTVPLVCCGSTGYPKPTPPPASTQPSYYDLFTSAPQTTSPKPPRKPVDLNAISSTTLPDRTLCGLERETPRLIGGTATGIDEFPWMVLIRYKDEKGADIGFKCGATLINNKYVLTAAHCLLTEEQQFLPYSVRLGEWRLSTDVDCVSGVAVDDCSEAVVDIDIKDRIVHPYFSPRSGNNDIALLRLEREVQYTDFIRPICLPPPDLAPPSIGTILTVSGWGATENGSQSDIKQKIDIPLVANAECAKRVSGGTRISPNQVCAGGVEGKDACQGDSGGPLMRTYVDDDSQWYQEGVVSRGRGCGKKGYAGIYTRVSRYVNWILLRIAETN